MVRSAQHRRTQEQQREEASTGQESLLSILYCSAFLALLTVYSVLRSIDMAVAFTHLSWWLWSGKLQKPNISSGSFLNSPSDAGLFELDTLRFHLNDRRSMTSSSRRVKKKWQSRDERRKIDGEYDVVIVPSDGGCISESESDDSDWSIGWLEHHGPGFQNDDESEDSFAVLVPCYGRGRRDQENNVKDKLFAGESKTHIEKWLLSLQRT